VSQPNRPKKGREAPRQNPLPAVLSAIIVVAIFVVLGFVLARSGSGSAIQTGEVPTTDAFFATTPPPAEPIPTPGEATLDPTQAAPEPAAAAGGAKTYSAAPPMTIDPQKSYLATITTPRGDIEIKLRPDLAPESVNNFVFLAREGFYNGLTWHRVIDGFMAQGGDPVGDGSGGPGYTIHDEFTDTVLFDRPGIVAMARPSAPDSAGSQFFITTAAAPHLNNQYTVFGEVLKGQEIANSIPLRDPGAATTPGEQIVKITITEQ
jgi:peptidylprolyl isomerase